MPQMRSSVLQVAMLKNEGGMLVRDEPFGFELSGEPVW